MGSRRRHWDSLCLWNWRQERTLKSKKRTERQTNTTRPDQWQYNLGSHPEPFYVTVKTWNWIGEFCLLCLLVLILIYGILLPYCCRGLSLLPSFYETQSKRVMQPKCSFLILCMFKFRKKKTQASSTCKRFLFAKSNDPQRLLILKVTRVPTIWTLRYISHFKKYQSGIVPYLLS